MPLLFIRTTDCEFVARDDGNDYECAEDALATGVRGALEIASEEMSRGGANCAVEITIENYDGTPVLRSTVAISISPLMAETRVNTGG